MSKVFKSIGHTLKPVIKIAAPIAGAYFGGPLGAALAAAATTKLYGGSWGDSLINGGLSGLTAGVLGSPGDTGSSLFNSANSAIYDGLSPLRSLAGDIGSSISNGAQSLYDGAKDFVPNLSSLTGGSGAASSALDAASADLQSGSSIGADFLSKAASSTGGSLTDPSGLLSGLKNSVTNPSLKDLTTLAALAQAVGGAGNVPGTQSQQDVMNNMASDKAAQAAQNEKFIASLNSAPLQRAVTTQPIDYYNYGSRPEVKFFDDTNNTPIKFAMGGRVSAESKASKLTGTSPLSSLGGQADTVNAKLSHGEYVIPADVVSHLGDGNTLAGSKSLDNLLKNVRKQKAPALKKGLLPPKSKSPLSYIGAMA